MKKKFFWLLLGIALGIFGMNVLKKRIKSDGVALDKDAIVDKAIDFFDRLKSSAQDIWQRYSGGQSLNDLELEKIFTTETARNTQFESSTDRSDISLN